MSVSRRLVRRGIFPFTAAVTAVLLSGLTALTGKDASVDDFDFSSFKTSSTCAVAFCGSTVLSVVGITAIRFFNIKVNWFTGSVLPLTGALLGIVEAVLVINLIVLEQLNPVEFGNSSASAISIPTRIAVLAAANIGQISFYAMLSVLIRWDRQDTALPTIRRRRSSMPTDSQGSQSIPMLSEKQVHSTNTDVPRSSSHSQSPKFPQMAAVAMQQNLSFAMEEPHMAVLNPPVPSLPSPPSPSNHNSWRGSFSSSLHQVQQAVRSTPSVRRMNGVGGVMSSQTARSSMSRRSVDSQSIPNSFDEYWDHPSPPEIQIKDMFTSITSPGTGMALESIPGSRPVSPARMLQDMTAGISNTSVKVKGSSKESSPPLASSASSIITLAPSLDGNYYPPSHPMPPRLGSSVSRTFSKTAAQPSQLSRPPTSYSTITTASATTRRYSCSRPPTPSSSYSSADSSYNGTYRPTSPLPHPAEAHIHPLFRSDSPTPPLITSPNTVVIASPFSGQVIGQISGTASTLASSRSMASFRSSINIATPVAKRCESVGSLRKASSAIAGTVSQASPALSAAALKTGGHEMDSGTMDDEVSTSWASSLFRAVTSAPGSGRSTPVPSPFLQSIGEVKDRLTSSSFGAPHPPSRPLSRQPVSRVPSVGTGPIPQFILDARRERIS